MEKLGSSEQGVVIEQDSIFGIVYFIKFTAACTNAVPNPGGRLMQGSKLARGLLVAQAVFFVAAGIGLWAQPEAACHNLAASRGLVASAVQCPSYTGAHAVFEMYSFSLGKHFWMIGVLFSYFALRSGRRDAVAAGLVYVPVALALDCLPPLSWFAEAGVVGPSSWAPIYTLTAVSALMGAVGLIANSRGANAVAR